MKYVLLPLRVLWKMWVCLNFGLGMIVLYPIFRILLAHERNFQKAFRLMRIWAKWIAYTSGLIPRVTVKGEAFSHQPCIYCANHSSYLDILMSYAVIPNYFVFIGKREIQKAPLFNVFFKKMNILVDRKSRMDAHRSFSRAMEDIDKGYNIFIFPEGGIFSRSPEVKPFKNGAFKIAVEKQIPIVPITFINNWELLQTGSFIKAKARPGIAKIIVHKAIPTKGLTNEDLVSLRDRTYTTIKSGFTNE